MPAKASRQKRVSAARIGRRCLVIVALLLITTVAGSGHALAMATPPAAPAHGAAGQATVAAPGSRDFPAMAYDNATGTVVLFGGLQGNTVLGDTWTWDGTSWTQQQPATSPPQVPGVAAYDGATGTAVLYVSSGPAAGGQTWNWDGMNWTEAGNP